MPQGAKDRNDDDDDGWFGSIQDLQHAPDRDLSTFSHGPSTRARTLSSIDHVRSTPLSIHQDSTATVRATNYNRRRFWSADNSVASRSNKSLFSIHTHNPTHHARRRSSPEDSTSFGDTSNSPQAHSPSSLPTLIHQDHHQHSDTGVSLDGAEDQAQPLQHQDTHSGSTYIRSDGERTSGTSAPSWPLRSDVATPAMKKNNRSNVDYDYALKHFRGEASEYDVDSDDDREYEDPLDPLPFSTLNAQSSAIAEGNASEAKEEENELTHAHSVPAFAQEKGIMGDDRKNIRSASLNQMDSADSAIWSHWTPSGNILNEYDDEFDDDDEQVAAADTEDDVDLFEKITSLGFLNRQKSNSIRASQRNSITETPPTWWCWCCFKCRRLIRLCNRNNVTLAVVKYSPCFIFLGMKIQTDRVILSRLNVLLIFLALYQIGIACFLAIVIMSPNTLEDRSFPNDGSADINPLLWNMNGCILIAALAALFILVSAMLTWRVIQHVNLVGAIRFFWALSWVMPFEAFCMLCLLDYHSVTTVWIKHWWNSTEMAWFRARYCFPADTANTLCTVPQIENGDEWCQINYNSTSCVSIRDAAQSQTFAFFRVIYIFSSAWCLVYTIVLVLTITTLEHIISRPLVQKSIQNNLPGWLSLPMIVCSGIGIILYLPGKSPAGIQFLGRQYSWIPSSFLAVAGFFLLAILLGWFISRSSIERTSDKNKKIVAVYFFIIAMILADIMLAAVFGACIAFIGSVGIHPISDQMRGTIACFLDKAGGCTRCNEEVNRCPEWTTDDVTIIYQTQALAIGAVSVIFFAYALRAIRFGLSMRRHILSYQIDYV